MILPLLVLVLYICWLVIYRLYFHPISKFPGPKLAAITSLYEFYFNALKGGVYIWEIEKMHQKYGPIVRITPHELHINDPYYYKEIYAGHTKRREKDPRFVGFVALPKSMITTIDHDLHKSRRSVLKNYFSKKAILSVQDMIKSKVEKLAARLEESYHAGEVVQLDAAFSAVTADIISEYSYGMSLDYLDDEYFKNDIRESVLSLFSLGHILKFLPLLLHVAKATPSRILQKVSPAAHKVLLLQYRVREWSIASLGKKTHVPGRETVFDALSDPNLPPEETTLDRLQDEGFVLLGAGTESTSKTLVMTMYHLLEKKSVLLKLRKELDRLPHATWSELEGLPYMRGVINEGLRLSFGVLSRLPRRAPDETLRYKEWVIPPGTTVSGSSYFIHMNPQLFPDPSNFDPERWILGEGRNHRLERLLVSFTKGSRQCLGINLAFAELYLVIATIVRQIDMDLYETTPDDIKPYRDFGIGFPKAGAKGLRIVATGIRSK